MEQTRTYQYRKVTKPLLERKRRARINKSLDQLKDLMVECLTQEGEHVVRLEKADILELTVDYLRKLKTRPTKITNSATVTENFRNGYINAANEVSKVLASTDGVDITLGKNVMTQLGCRLHDLQQQYAETIGIFTTTSIENNYHEQNINNQITMCPLKIDLPMSPASSGYQSDLMSPTSSEESFDIKNKVENNSVWRPW